MQYVGAVIGAAVGFYAGGPQGAVYGAQIGYTIGSVIEASNQKIVTEGPRLTDLHVTFSTYGAFDPRIYVRAGNIGGNIIDSSGLIPTMHETESGGKGGPTSVQKTETYAATFRVKICKSDGDRTVTRIWANGTLIWSRRPEIDAASLLAAVGLVEQVIVYAGADEQLPDPSFEAMNGVDNEPAYLGVLSVVFVGFQLANYSNSVQSTQLTFEVVQTPNTETIERPLNEGGRDPLFGQESMYAFGPDYDRFVMQDVFDGAGLQRIGQFATSDAPIKSLSVVANGNTFSGCPPPVYRENAGKAAAFDGPVQGPRPLVFRLFDTYRIIVSPYTIFDYQTPPSILCTGTHQEMANEGTAGVAFYTPMGLKQGSIPLGETDRDIREWRRVHGASEGGPRQIAAAGLGAFAYAETVGQASFLMLKSGSVATLFTYPDARICGILFDASHCYALSEEDYVTSAGFEYRLRVYDLDVVGAGGAAVEVANYAGPRGPASRLVFDLFMKDGSVCVVVAGRMRWKWDSVDGTLTTMADLLTDTSSKIKTIMWQDDGLFALSTLPIDPNGTQVSRLYADSVTGGGKPLREVIAEIAAEKDFTALDFAHLPDDVVCNGYVVTRQTSPRVAIDYLRDLFRVDCRETADNIGFVLRGGPPVRTLLAGPDLGAREDTGGDDPPDAALWNTADELGAPAQVQLKYTDRDNVYEQGTVIVKRETTTSQEVKTLDATAVMLTGTEAARFAQQALDDAWNALETVSFSTTYAHELLETADPILLPGKVKQRRARINGKTDKGGLIDWTGVRDDAASTVGAQVVVGGAATGNPGTSGTTMVGGPVTRAVVLNLPSLRPQDDDAGFYIGTAPTSLDRFRGADVYDQASTAARRIASITTPGARGFASTVLPVFAGGSGFDSAAFVDVAFGSGVTLESAQRAQILAGGNIFLIGSEIVGVISATALGGNVWRLGGGLLRGMRGTEEAVTGHVAGEAVYLLSAASIVRDRNATAVDADGRETVVVGAVTTGRNLSDLVNFSTTGVNTRQALVPFAPSDFVVAPAGADMVLRAKWQRRSRKIQPDPFRVPLDQDLSATASGGNVQFEVQSSPDREFGVQVQTLAVTGALEWTYDAFRRFFDYVSGTTDTFWLRVAERGPTLKPGAGSAPVQVTLPAATFPVSNAHLSTRGANGETAFSVLNLYGDASSAGVTVSGAVHKQANRAVFAGGDDAISFPIFDDAILGFGIGRWAMRVSFATSNGGAQTVFSHRDAGFGSGSIRLAMEAGALVLWFGDYSSTAPLFRTQQTFADGTEHIVDLYSLSVGAFNHYGLRVDGAVVAGNVFKNVNGGRVAGDYVLGNDPNTPGTGFVGAMGDFQGVGFSF